MANKNEVLEKIRKLLAVAYDSGATENEAKTAMLLAQKIMAQHGLDEKDTVANEKQEIIIVPLETYRNLSYRTTLATVISENFKCKVIFYGDKLSFIGFKNDAEVAKQVFEYAYKIAHRFGSKEYNEYREKGKNTKGVFPAYTQGFVLGLKKAFDEQCKALMVVVPSEVKEELEKRTTGYRKTKQAHKNNSYGSFEKGVKDGKEFMNKQKTAIADK